MKVQKAGIQNQAGETLLEKGGSASVRTWYTRTVLSKFVSDATPSTLRQHTHRYQSPLFELPYNLFLTAAGRDLYADTLFFPVAFE